MKTKKIEIIDETNANGSFIKVFVNGYCNSIQYYIPGCTSKFSTRFNALRKTVEYIKERKFEPKIKTLKTYDI